MATSCAHPLCPPPVPTCLGHRGCICRWAHGPHPMIPPYLKGAHGSFTIFEFWAMCPLDPATSSSIILLSKTKR